MALRFDKTTYFFNWMNIRTLQCLVIALFLGRAWQALFWDLPLRTFFWDEELLGGVVVHLTDDTWQHYVTNESMPTDQWIDGLSIGLGLFWMICALVTPLGFRYLRLTRAFLYAGAISLLLLAVLYAKDHYWQVAQLFEYVAQVTAPLFLVAVYQTKSNTSRFRWGLRIVIATTFVCHGLYAYGFYPQPGAWVTWCRNILGVETDESVRLFLTTMGVLDFIAAIGLFIPWKWIEQPAIVYCIVWGFLTALARLWGNFYSDMLLVSLHQHTYEVIYRLVHGGLPLLLWQISYSRGTTTTVTHA